MSFLNLQASYFAIPNPFRIADRWFNRFRHRQRVCIRQREVEVRWSGRAERALQRMQQPLIVELQLYFSCVVKKRVVFHQQVNFDTTVVNNRLELGFRPIAAAVCDPREFSAHYPAGKTLSQTAQRMVPRRVEIDFRRGNWEGCFAY